MTPPDTSPLVLHGRRRSAARLRSGVLLWESAGVRREIPVAAIERVDVRGRRGRELTVVLTSALPDPATHSLTSRSAPAVREFAGPEPRNVPLGVLGVLYVLVVAALPVRGAGERATVSWLVGIPCVLAPGVAAVVAGLRMLRDTVVLRARGIAVEGRLESSHDVGTGEDAVTHCVYSYADVSMTLLGFSLVGTAVAALFG